MFNELKEICMKEINNTVNKMEESKDVAEYATGSAIFERLMRMYADFVVTEKQIEQSDKRIEIEANK